MIFDVSRESDRFRLGAIGGAWAGVVGRRI